MFSAKQRLSRPAFTEYFKAGRRFQTPALTLVYSPTALFGVSAVVGKKVSKLAVGRNRIRRRIYAGMRRSFDELSLAKGVYIVIAKPIAAKYTREALAAELATLLALPFKSR
jgi:ribonuclease P protein component